MQSSGREIRTVRCRGPIRFTRNATLWIPLELPPETATVQIDRDSQVRVAAPDTAVAAFLEALEQTGR